MRFFRHEVFLVMQRAEVSIDVIVHATEDVAKFYSAFESVFALDPESFRVQTASGHFDNPITMLNARLKKKDGGMFVQRLVSGMQEGQVDVIIEDLDELVSSAGLHLRLDKQRFVEGDLALRDGDALKVRIYTPVYNKKDTAGAYTKLLEDALN